jgi:hypothetical protein
LQMGCVHSSHCGFIPPAASSLLSAG